MPLVTIGATLLSAAEQWAATRGFDSVTLTTYGDVPWQRALLLATRLERAKSRTDGPGTQGLRERERDQGPKAWPRQAMIKRL